MHIKKYILLLCILAITSIANTALAQRDIPLPKQSSPARLVNDFAGLLQQNEIDALESKLVNYDKQTSNQICVVIIDSLMGYAVTDYAYDLFNKWGIGDKEKENGVLVLVATKNRKMRIEVGNGLGGAIPAIRAFDIISNVMQPAFKQGQYFNGLDVATTQIMQLSQGEFTGKDDYYSDSGGSFIFILLILAFFIFMFIVVNRNKNKQFYQSRRGHRGWDDPWIGSGPFIGGGGFGGFGGGGDSGGGFGGFGGFGGGDSGGGGASGDW